MARKTRQTRQRRKVKKKKKLKKAWHGTGLEPFPIRIILSIRALHALDVKFLTSNQQSHGLEAGGKWVAAVESRLFTRILGHSDTALENIGRDL